MKIKEETFRVVGIKFFFSKKNLAPKKCSNFFVFQNMKIKIKLISNLVLIRSIPRSFYHLVIFGTPYGDSLGEVIFQAIQIGENYAVAL